MTRCDNAFLVLIVTFLFLGLTRANGAIAEENASVPDQWTALAVANYTLLGAQNELSIRRRRWKHIE